MEDNKRTISKRITGIYTLIVFMVPLLYVIVNLHRTSGPVLPPDEFGYWKNAAEFMGIDWSGAFYMQPYYAKGYSILLWPLMVLLKDPLTMYKCALIVNALLFGLSGLVLFLLAGELTGTPGASDRKCFLVTVLAGVFYPAHFVYMNYTIAESLLYLLVLLAFLMLARYEKSGKPVYAILAVVVAILCTLVHFRTVCVLAAIIIAVAAKQRMDRKGENVIKAAAPFVLMLVLAALAAAVLSALSVRTGFGYLDTFLDKVQKSLTLTGIADTVMGIAGKIFYICVSTFGLFFFYAKRVWERRRDSLIECTFFFAFLLSVIISSVFLVASHGVYFLVYGRYNEIFAPVIVCLGLVQLGDMAGDKNAGKDLWIRYTVVTALLSAVLTCYALFNGMNEYVRESVIGMSWFFGDDMPTVNMLILIPSIACIIALLLFTGFSKKPEGGQLAKAVAVLTVFMFICFRMSDICVYDFHDIDKSDTKLYEEAVRMYDEGREVVFLRYPWSNYVGHLQFYMWDRKITFIEGLDPEAFETADTAVVFTYPDYEEPEQLQNRYNTEERSAHFNMYFNR